VDQAIKSTVRVVRLVLTVWCNNTCRLTSTYPCSRHISQGTSTSGTVAVPCSTPLVGVTQSLDEVKWLSPAEQAKAYLVQ